MQKALSVLELLASEPRGLRITEIAKSAALPYATAHRIVSTLQDMGYIQPDYDSGRYYMGLKVLRWQAAVLQRLSLPRIAYPHMVGLMMQVKETVHIAVLDDGEVVYLNTVLSPRSLSMYTLTGKRAPAHCTALGKVLLAYLPEAEVRRIANVKGLTAFTAHTITDIEQLLSVLQRVRERGFSIDDQELEVGVRCVASHVVNHEDRTIAAVSVSAPAQRLGDDAIPVVVSALRDACRAISKELGASSSDIEPM